MKPTTEEKQWLKEYLYEALSYRETYDEVYDHILQALEHKPAQEFFESTVYEIIDEDFGGSINMLNMEVDCRVITDSDVKQQYWRVFFDWLKSPLTLYILPVAVAVFFCTATGISILFLAGIGVLTTILQVVLISVRSYRIGRIYGDTKSSIRDSAFRWLIYGYFIVSTFIINPASRFLMFMIQHSLPKAAGILAGRFVITFFFMITVVHTLTLIKIYREEFKTKMILR